MKRLSFLMAFLLAMTCMGYSQGYQVGDVATDFKLKNVDGKMVSLSDFPEAKGFVVIFTCNHCPYSQAYEERIIALDTKYDPQGYPVIAINPNDPDLQPEDSYESMQKRAGDKNFTYPYLIDEGQKIFPVYGATRTPHAFVLEKSDSGYIVRYIGAIDDNFENPSEVKNNYVADAVDTLLLEGIVDVPFTKAVGCGIKMKK